MFTLKQPLNFTLQIFRKKYDLCPRQNIFKIVEPVILLTFSQKPVQVILFINKKCTKNTKKFEMNVKI